MTWPKPMTLNCLVVTAGFHQLTAAIWGNLYYWDKKAYQMKKQRNTQCSSVQCASLLWSHTTCHMKQVRRAKQMAWEATRQGTSALNRWHQQDARKSSVSLWTWEHNRKVSRDSYWGSCHHINTQHVKAIQQQPNNFQNWVLYTFLLHLI